MERIEGITSQVVLNIFLADDDRDDCSLFKEALEELQVSSNLTTVHNGEQLMNLLNDATSSLPDVLFLDLNMPRKSGFQCLEEIKQDEKLRSVPIFIYSTSFDESIADNLNKTGATHFICKPAEFSLLKNVVHQALTLLTEARITKPADANFILGNIK